jgi:hypothetical protein
MSLKRLASGLLLASAWVFPTFAQQPPPSTDQPLARPLPGALPCTSFKKNAEGDWAAKQAMVVPGSSGPVQVAAGTVLSEDLQIELDDRCKN